ncbi:MAG: YicC/YloC family endoribonuclease [bacterium]
MIVSMTGFGRGEVKEDGVEVLVEIRTLNHRFLDVSLRIPKSLNYFESDIREMIRSNLTRGRVEVTVSLKSEEQELAGLTVDKVLAASYLKLLEELKKEFGLQDSIRIEHLLQFSDIITVASEKPSDENAWKIAKKALQVALSDLLQMRIREGNEMKKDLVGRIEVLNRLLQRIEEKSHSRSSTEYEKLKERLREITEAVAVDEGRLEMEIALFADRVDVTEECTRFKSHNDYFLELLDNEETAGRKLNFLLQEMHREANTIGSKANDSQIAHWVVETKEEIEKLREQIQNIE